MLVMSTAACQVGVYSATNGREREGRTPARRCSSLSDLKGADERSRSAHSAVRFFRRGRRSLLIINSVITIIIILSAYKWQRERGKNSGEAVQLSQRFEGSLQTRTTRIHRVCGCLGRLRLRQTWVRIAFPFSSRIGRNVTILISSKAGSRCCCW
jgi:hypothetical protein